MRVLQIARSAGLRRLTRVLAAALALGVGLGLTLRAVRRGAVPDRPEARPDLEGMVISLKVTPPAPAVLEVTGPGPETRRMASYDTLAEHRFRLDKLERGTMLEARGRCGTRTGPPLAFAYEPLRPENVVVDEGPRGLTVRLKVARPLACALLVRTRSGIQRVGSDAPGLTHDLAVSDQLMPFGPDIHVRLSGDGQVVEERLAWDDAGRRNYLLCAGAWLATQAETLIPPAFTGAGAAPASLFDQVQSSMDEVASGAVGRGGLDARLVAAANALPPEWFLEKLGGADGLLDRTDIPVDLRRRFDAALHLLEVLDSALMTRNQPVRYPYHRLYGARVGPSLTTRVGRATGVPLLSPGQDTSKRFLLVPDIPIARQTLSFKDGLPKTFLLRTNASLGPQPRSGRAELRARLTLRPGVFVDVSVNGKPAVRLCRPVKERAPGGGIEYFGGFDAGLLKEGDNAIELRCSGMPAVIENSDLDHGVIVHPPGFVLRVKS